MHAVAPTTTSHAEALARLPAGALPTPLATFWRERAEAAAQAALHAAYTGQSAHTVAGRRAEYQPMCNGIDKGLKQDHNAYTNGDNDHA